MKRLTRFFARLYPASWRDRYGDEFEAVVDQANPSTRDAADVLKGAVTMRLMTGSFGKTLLICAMAGAMAAFALSFAFQPSYQSEAVISVTLPDNELEKSKGPAAANQAMFDVIETLTQRVLSRNSLTRIVLERGLYPVERTRMPLEDVVEMMRKRISVRIVGSKTSHIIPAFTVGFVYPDRNVAHDVTASLMSSFIDRNVDTPHTTPIRLQALYAASLPLKPMGFNRWWIATGGLFAGLLAGLTIAFVRRLRRQATV